jgi:integrase
VRIRPRPAKNTRHTYATVMLMANAKPSWAAAQLGHSLDVFLKKYAKWIPGADRGEELAKVEAFTNAGSVPVKATEPVAATGKSTGKRPRKARLRAV